MSEFLSAVAVFPTALFSAALVVVVAFWLLVLFGAVEHDMFDSDAEAAGAGSTGLGGVPITVAVSLLVTIAWFTCLAGALPLRGSGLTGVPYAATACAILLAAVFLSWHATLRLVRVLATLFPDEPGPSRHDFVGLTCTIRTGRVDGRFGQAEVAAPDGSTAVVQVRQAAHESETLALGATGLLYAYDEDGEFFWVSPSSPYGELPGIDSPAAA
ncbi:hypothetical protein EAO77_08420 [Streptomyces sp. t39]|nr:hypothetical protein EAO77_08420 [Streptomyces sp. t39]